MVFKVLETETFQKRFDSLDRDEESWVRKMVLQVREHPELVGKPLKFSWFREKKFRDKRLYYIVYPDLMKVLMVAFGGKKEQQRIIDVVLRNAGAYRKLAEELV